MVKRESDKEWQRKNAHKARQYSAKYDSVRAKTTVYLEHWVTKEIDRVKEPEQAYGNWIRLHIEEWARHRQSQESTPDKE